MAPISIKELKKEAIQEKAPCPKCGSHLVSNRRKPGLDKLHGYRLLRCKKCHVKYTQWFDPPKVTIDE